MEYRLLYNAAAHFETLEQYPNGIIEAIAEPGKKGFEALCFALDCLSHQAEAARAYLGQETREPISEEWALKNMRIVDIVKAKTAVFDAVSKGIGESADSEVDEVLLELQKKTERSSTGQDT